MDQILDEATDTAVLSGLPALREAQRQSDPSTAAEGCLAARGRRSGPAHCTGRGRIWSEQGFAGPLASAAMTSYTTKVADPIV